MRFGIYMMRRGVLSAEQLIEALDEQMSLQPPMGQLAIEEGVLSVREVFAVLRTQADTANGRFGDAAMQLGLLDRGQVANLLMLQADRIPPLSDLLVSIGTLDQATVDNELASFRRDMERSGAKRSDAPSNALAPSTMEAAVAVMSY